METSERRWSLYENPLSGSLADFHDGKRLRPSFPIVQQEPHCMRNSLPEWMGQKTSPSCWSTSKIWSKPKKVLKSETELGESGNPAAHGSSEISEVLKVRKATGQPTHNPCESSSTPSSPRNGQVLGRSKSPEMTNGLDALLVKFTSSFPCRFFFSTLLVLLSYPARVDPQQKPHPNRVSRK